MVNTSGKEKHHHKDPDPAQNHDADPDPEQGGGERHPKMCVTPGKILGTPLIIITIGL